MPTIKPLTDLRSYSSVLAEVTEGNPVFLTKNGRGRFVLLDIKDYEKYEAEDKLLAQLDYGKQSAAIHGTYSTDEVKRLFQGRFKD